MSEEAKATLGLPHAPTWRDVARSMKKLALERGEWAGYPVPLTDMQLVLEPRFPLKAGLEGFMRGAEPEPHGDVVNSFYSSRHGCVVDVVRGPDGRSRAGVLIDSKVDKVLATLGAVEAWLIEAEAAAVEKLASMVEHRQFLHYMMTGVFLERSQRSGVHYLFRRLRPTLAIRCDDRGGRVLCGLCLHPVGYYAGTWAGCQAPTDDVVAHLCMMRGDEPKFWANANQHPAYLPSCGI